MQIFPQATINVRMQRRFDLKKSSAVQQALRNVEAELGNAGRVVLRASGTEPVVRVTVEAQDIRMVERLSQALADAVRQAAQEVA